ncbi:unnamed protein product [Boreogadus saida]
MGNTSPLVVSVLPTCHRREIHLPHLTMLTMMRPRPHNNFPLFNTLCVFHNNFPNFPLSHHIPFFHNNVNIRTPQHNNPPRAMGGAATPHMKTKDEKDEIVNLRPLKKIESAEGRTIVYEPSNPKDIERWSAEIDHPRRAGLQPWMQLKQLMHLYELHPNDGLAILFKHLSSTERTQIRYDVEEAMGEDGMRPEKGWEAIKAWIQKHSKAQVNWKKITRCMQKEDEGLDQFNERFFECYLLYSGQTEYDMDNIDQSTDLPLKTMYLQQVLPEIRRGVKTRLPSWENRSCPMAEIIEFGENVDRDEEVRIRFLADEKRVRQPRNKSSTTGPL